MLLEYYHKYIYLSFPVKSESIYVPHVKTKLNHNIFSSFYTFLSLVMSDTKHFINTFHRRVHDVTFFLVIIEIKYFKNMLAH